MIDRLQNVQISAASQMTKDKKFDHIIYPCHEKVTLASC